MALNRRKANAWNASEGATHPTTPATEGPVRFGSFTGVAITDERTGGETTIDFNPREWDISVDDNLGSAIAIGDPLYYHDTGTGTPTTSVNNDPNGANAFFGWALAVVAANATPTILVFKATPGMRPTGEINATLINGTTAGAHTVTGIALGDRIVSVFHISTLAAIATMAVLTSEFSITAANTIDNTAGTDTSSDQLMVIWEDLT